MTAFSPPEVWCAQTAEELKSFPVDYNILSPDIYSAHSGPDEGVKFVKSLLSKEDCTNNNSKQDTEVKRPCTDLNWSYLNRKAFGLSTSLYDKNPATGKVSGDPIADCYAYVARKNNALLIVADGVNWGDKSKIAARCAVGAAVDYIHESMFVEMNRLQTTTDALLMMRKAFDVAHESILKHSGGLTTLNLTMVLPIMQCSQYAVCSVNVGDSLTFVFSKRYGMNELSIGSHDINQERDMRDAGGAVGPVNGDQPYLVNLTFSVTTCEPGDVIFLTTDGISDNFDPVVTKIAVPGRKDSLTLSSVDQKAEMLPHERHLFAMKGMERIIHEYELETEADISAQELCMALNNHVTNLTQPKRLVIENPAYYSRQFKAKERRKIEETIKTTIRTMPGKLDHATVVAYEAGVYRDEVSPNTSYEVVSNHSGSVTGSEQSSVSSATSNYDLSSSTVYESNV